jgi:hypothetical protein
LTQEKETYEDLPGELVERLKAGEQRPPLLTAKVDREILSRAEGQFASRRPAHRRPPVWAALAATVVLGLFIAQFWSQNTVDEGAVYADVDQSGRIDIADVLAAARNGTSQNGAQANLDAFAMRVVSLDTDGDSS